MKLRNIILSIAAASMLFCGTPSYAGNAVVVSGEASEEMSEAAVQLVSASANLSGAGIALSGAAGISVGHALSETVLSAAEISGDTVAFSSAVLVAGMLTTAQLSRDLVSAGIIYSSSAALLAGNAVAVGIHMSVETAGLFLDQAVNIAAASGRLSGEVGELALVLAGNGVVISADSVILVANAVAKGVDVSQEQAERFIAKSLAIAAECIEAAVITERYLVMTLEEANTLLKEASLATVRTCIHAGQKTYHFSKETSVHLYGLGIDVSKLAMDLARQAARKTSVTIVETIQGANDATVVVINTGSGLIVAKLDTLTEAVEETIEKIK